MRIIPRLVVIGALGVALGVMAAILWPDSYAAQLVVLGAAVTAGELLVLRPVDRSALPTSYAVFLVLLRAAPFWQFVVVVVAAEALAIAFRRGMPTTRNVERSVISTVAAIAAFGAFAGVHSLADSSTTVTALLALGAAGVAEIVVDDTLMLLLARRVPTLRAGRSADLALISSGILMSFGYAGTDIHSGMGLWGALLLSIPLLGAWYSFARLASIRRTYEQTIAALSVVPEMAAVSESGHAIRVADLSVRVGSELGLGRRDLEFLHAAASLHHLGHLCLDDPEVLGRPVQPYEVADKGAEILKQTEYLAPAGAFLASESPLVGGQILRVTSAFDDITRGNPALARTAIERLALVPGAFDDPRVLVALERVVVGSRTA